MRTVCWMAAALALPLLGSVVTAQGLATYKNPARGVDERAADLLARMTLEEKVAQLQGSWKRNSAIQRPDGSFNPDGAAALPGKPLIDRRMRRVVEPGRFEIMAGTSSATTLTATLDVAER